MIFNMVVGQEQSNSGTGSVGNLGLSVSGKTLYLTTTEETSSAKHSVTSDEESEGE